MQAKTPKAKLPSQKTHLLFGEDPIADPAGEFFSWEKTEETFVFEDSKILFDGYPPRKLTANAPENGWYGR